MGLTVTDTGDGTGGTATVSGTNPAATNTLYRASFDGQMGAHTWASTGSRTGDGTIAIASPSPVPLGFYLWRLDSLLAGVTTVYTAYQNLTTPEQSLLYQILIAVGIRVRSLGLSGLASADVLERWIPRVRPDQQTPPKVIVCPWEKETFPGVLTGRDDVGIPVMVAITSPGNDDETRDLNKLTLWRQRIERSLSFQRLPGVDRVINCLPEPGQIIGLEAFLRANLIFSALAFRFITRLPRGLT